MRLTFRLYVLFGMGYTGMVDAWGAGIRPTTKTTRSRTLSNRRIASSCTSNPSILQLDMASSIHHDVLITGVKNPFKSERRGYALPVTTSRNKFATTERSLEQQTSWNGGLMSVISSALLITASTFGAGSLVLPEMVQGPGLAASSGVFLAAYTINLVSGLTLAEVAIQQMEAHGKQISSLKEMVQETLQSPQLATLASVVSIVYNTLVLSFAISRFGTLAHQITGGFADESLMSVVWGGSLAMLLGTQSSQRISNVASACVAVLLASFGSLLLPGLAHSDPVAAWCQPGLAVNHVTALGELGPIILMSLTFQNIVPTVTRVNDYFRTKTVASVVLGSLIPLVMYLLWCTACLGGGIDLASLNSATPLLPVFSLATLAGSSIGCGTSCASEVKTFVAKAQQDTNSNTSMPAAFVAVSLSLGLVLASGGGDLTPALSLAGGIGVPVLYGALPVWMAWKSLPHPTTDVPLVQMSSWGVLGTVACMFGTSLVEQVRPMTDAAPAIL